MPTFLVRVWIGTILVGVGCGSRPTPFREQLEARDQPRFATSEAAAAWFERELSIGVAASPAIGAEAVALGARSLIADAAAAPAEDPEDYPEDDPDYVEPECELSFSADVPTVLDLQQDEEPSEATDPQNEMMARVRQLACTPWSDGCRSRFVRNPTSTAAECRGTTIRVNQRRINDMAASLRYDEPKAHALFTGIVAHEYGHFLDQLQRKRARMDFFGVHKVALLAAAAAPPIKRELARSTHWKGELFADAVASCVLARSKLEKSLLVTAIRELMSTSSNTHPGGAIRVEALEIGFSLCAARSTEADIFDVLLARPSPPSR